MEPTVKQSKKKTLRFICLISTSATDILGTLINAGDVLWFICHHDDRCSKVRFEKKISLCFHLDVSSLFYRDCSVLGVLDQHISDPDLKPHVETLNHFWCHPINLQTQKHSQGKGIRWWGNGEIGVLINCLWEYKVVQLLWKNVWWFIKKFNVKFPYDPEIIILLGIYPRGLKTHIHTNPCTWALFI